jgi:hypothetical protein
MPKKKIYSGKGTIPKGALFIASRYNSETGKFDDEYEIEYEYEATPVIQVEKIRRDKILKGLTFNDDMILLTDTVFPIAGFKPFIAKNIIFICTNEIDYEMFKFFGYKVVSTYPPLMGNDLYIDINPCKKKQDFPTIFTIPMNNIQFKEWLFHYVLHELYVVDDDVTKDVALNLKNLNSDDVVYKMDNSSKIKQIDCANEDDTMAQNALRLIVYKLTQTSVTINRTLYNKIAKIFDEYRGLRPVKLLTGPCNVYEPISEAIVSGTGYVLSAYGE